MPGGAAAAAYQAQAALWWGRATLLLPVAALKQRFAGVANLAADPRMAAATETCTPPESPEGQGP